MISFSKCSAKEKTKARQKKNKKTADLTKTKIGFISCIPRNYYCKYIIYYSPIVSFEKKSCYLHFSA